MTEIKKTAAVIKRAEKLSDDIYSMWLAEKDIAAAAIPGQFINIYCQSGGRLLPRPISICDKNQKEGLIRIVFRTAGEGTRELSRLKEGEMLEIMGPLGNGYDLSRITKEKAILIGGGIGIPPMLALAKAINCEKTKHLMGGTIEKPIIVLGYRDSYTFLMEEFKACGRVLVSTEDGSIGTKGNVIDAVKAHSVAGDILFACGPAPMLRGVKAFAQKNNIPAQLSLEERMACGIGACLACVCKSAEVDAHSHVHNKRVCKDGPVFWAEEVELG